MIWGENPQYEYGGPGLGNKLDYEWLKTYGGFWLDKFSVKEVALKHKIELRHLNPYVYPTKQELDEMVVDLKDQITEKMKENITATTAKKFNSALLSL